MLATQGHQVRVAEDGPAGLKELEQNDYAVVITDYSMPGMNGREVAASAKAMRPGVFVILLTGWPVEQLGSSDDAKEDIAVQKEQMIRRILHKRRNPHYEGLLRKFENKVKALPVSQNVKVTPSPYFEKDYIEIDAKIHSIRELEQFATQLRDNAWKKIFEEDEVG